jgi:SAM-dependent methyltransferase
MTLSYPVDRGPICPVCLSGQAKGRGVWTSETGPYDLYACGRCRVHYSWPMIPASTEFYGSCSFYEAREFFRLRPLRRISLRDWRIRAFRRLELPEGRLLDVGCGHGEMVWAATQMGHEAFGVDMDEKAVAVARRLGIPNVTVGRAEDSPAGPFDIVTSFDVLEHLQDPVLVLSGISRILAPGGHVVIAVPAWDKGPFLHIPKADNPPHHLTMWTETAVEALADRAGFRVERLIRKPYGGYDFIVVLLHRWSRFGRDTLAAKASRRLVLAVSVVKSAVLRALFRFKGGTILASLSPR